MTEATDKIIGCILGGAVGDAVGLPYEGYDSTVEAVELKGQQISDDTQLTLATCEAIIEHNGIVEPSVIASRFASWHANRRVSGIGASTHKALSELVAGGHWALVGRKGEYAAGNGAAMRIAPLAFCLNPKDHDSRQMIRDVSRITHHNEEAFIGALGVTIAIRVAWAGQLDFLPYVIESIPDSKVRDRLAAMRQLQIDAPLIDIARRFGCSGYVVESVPFALYGVQRVSLVGFENLMRELISVGGDTDTIASIAGQIAGTLIGKKELPQHLVAQLQELSFIEGVANQFAQQIIAGGAV